MGNCQAADISVAAIVEHPSGRTEKVYWAVTARHLMLQNPGYYLALCPNSSPPSGDIKQDMLKLLPPAAALSPGNRYRLISFEEILGGEQTSKKGGRSKNSRRLNFQMCKASPKDRSFLKNVDQVGLRSICSQRYNIMHWRPSLQSISEMERCGWDQPLS